MSDQIDLYFGSMQRLFRQVAIRLEHHLDRGKPGGREVFSVNDHQLLAFLFIEQMHQAHVRNRVNRDR